LLPRRMAPIGLDQNCSFGAFILSHRDGFQEPTFAHQGPMLCLDG
jgi:hypothetical protein